MLSLVLFAAVLAGRTSQAGVDPVAKVVELLTNLKSEVETEGTAEAGTYDTFACFCKSETIAKAAAIDRGDTKKAKLEAELESLAADDADQTYSINKLTEDLGNFQVQLKKAQDVRNADNQAYLELNADLEKAVSSLKAAIQSISGSKSFVQTSEAGQAVRASLMIADALGMTPKNKVVQALLQGTPTANENDYDFHSDDILGILRDLQTDFKAQDAKADSEEEAERRSFANSESKKKTQIRKTENALSTQNTKLTNTEAAHASKTGFLTETSAKLNDDTLYLKDLTAQCEAKAREWDQRSAQRAGEIEALGSALATISGKVANKSGKTGAGGRAFVQQEEPSEEATSADEESVDDYSDVVFVQTAVVQKATTEVDPKRTKAVTVLQKEAEQLKSVDLSLLAMRLAADPFAKVKTLIQELIERLLKEAAEEANQKGWCDTSLAKANTDRDFRQGDLEDLSSEINEMTSSKVTLEENVKQLKREVKELEQAHSQAARIRNREKRENKRTLDNASEGLAALRDATAVLKDFYKGAAKGTVSLVQTDASPVSEKMANAGTGEHLGAYNGKQTQANGILGMLETIASDFERTIKQTGDSETAASRAFTKFDRETKASVAGKETGIARSESDIIETTGNLKAAYFSLQQNQQLLDTAMKTLETLRPQCVDTTMTHEERLARREAEVAALKTAVCVLDEEDEAISSCSGGSWTGSFLQKK